MCRVTAVLCLATYETILMPAGISLGFWLRGRCQVAQILEDFLLILGSETAGGLAPQCTVVIASTCLLPRPLMQVTMQFTTRQGPTAAAPHVSHTKTYHHQWCMTHAEW